MAESESAFRIYGFAGLDKEIRPETLDDRQLTEAENVLIETSGEVYTRHGLQEYQVAPANAGMVIPVSLESWITVNRSSELFYKMVTDLGNSGVVWTQLQNSTGATNMVQYGSEWYFPRSFGAFPVRVRKFGGASGTPASIATTELANSPSGAKYITFYKERLFTAGGVLTSGSGQPQRLWFSQPGDFTNWPSTNFIDIGFGSLKALLVYKDILVIFSSDGIYTLRASGDPADWVVDQVTDEYILSNWYSFVLKDGVIYLLDFDRGIFATDLVSFQEIGTPIWEASLGNQINANSDISSLSALDFHRILYTRGNALNTAGDDFLCDHYVYDTRTQAWTEWSTNMRSNGDTRLPGPIIYGQVSGKIRTFIGDLSLQGPASLHEYDENKTQDRLSDNITWVNIPFSVKTKSFTHEMPEKFKRVKWVAVDFIKAPASLTDFTYEVDGVELTPILIADPEPPVYAPYKIKGPGYAKSYSIKIHGERGGGFRLSGLTVVLHQKRSFIKNADVTPAGI